MEMPEWFKYDFKMAYLKKDKDAIIRFNKAWREYLKESYNIVLKG